MDFWAEYSSPIGPLLLTSDGAALTGLWMGCTPPPGEGKGCALLDRAAAWLDAYFRGERREIDFPLSPGGTNFQQRVWAILETIPMGETMTYGQIAGMLGDRMSAQAVGGAVGKNPISIIIPCHRVLGAGGRLTGYAGGLDKKRWLLEHEGIPYRE